MKESTRAYALIALTLALIAANIAVVMMTQPAQASEIEPDWTWRVSPKDTTNTRALTEIRLQQLGDKLTCIGETETARLEAEQWEAEQAYYGGGYVDSGGYSGGDWYADYSAAYNSDGPSRTMPGWHDGRKETYYSSNVLYHYRTGEWTVDDEGFYRTDEGYYVVGVSMGDYALGDTFEGGKGTCYVADFGWTDEPITDYYTNW